MNRRRLIGLLGGAAAWPLAAGAQGMPVIGYLTSRGAADDARFSAAFRQGLKEAGFVAGQNVAIEYRYAGNDYERLPALIAELVRSGVAMLVTGGAPVAPVAAKTATTLPIVFVIGGDPVAAGLVASLSRPGGHLTGINVLNAELTPKKLELLHELVPSAKVIAALVNPGNPNMAVQVDELQAAVRSGGPRLEILRAGTEAELDAAFAAASKLGVGAMVIGSDAYFNGQGKMLAERSLRHAIPSIFTTRDFAVAGGLLSYGASIAEAFRLAGGYAGRILKGEKPADLPVQQSSKFDMIINLKTAKALGIKVPLPLLGRADEVIE